MTSLGTSFTRWRAEALGLDYRSAFTRICGMGFALLRLSASWREITEFGWSHLDWLMGYAEEVGQPVLLTLGMKALGWPEFYLPQGLDPADPDVERQALRQVCATVDRFAGHRTLTAWQIENEPFNRSGPQGRWIPRSLVRREASAVRSLDPTRPVAITCFGHFNEGLDRASSRHQSDWKRRLGLDFPAEREALAVLGPGDILGLDVYRSIGWLDQTGQARIARAADDQFGHVLGWQRIAREQGKRLWVMEAQAEPWEARPETRGNPLTVSPPDVVALLQQLASASIETVLLWGCEYWLWRENHGDRSWIDAVTLDRQALAPPAPG